MSGQPRRQRRRPEARLQQLLPQLPPQVRYLLACLQAPLYRLALFVQQFAWPLLRCSCARHHHWLGVPLQHLLL